MLSLNFEGTRILRLFFDLGFWTEGSVWQREPRGRGSCERHLRFHQPEDRLKGVVQAQFRLGYCLDQGLGALACHEEAAQWYRRASEGSHAWAMFRLGLMYEQGLGVDASLSKAAECFRGAAELDWTEAQTKLGLCYESGRGVPQQYVDAAKWFRRAAEKADIQARERLGYYYHHGIAMDRDYQAAIAWYSKVVDSGELSSQANIAECYEATGALQDAYQWHNVAAAFGSTTSAGRRDALVLSLDPLQVAATQRRPSRFLSSSSQRL